MLKDEFQIIEVKGAFRPFWIYQLYRNYVGINHRTFRRTLVLLALNSSSLDDNDYLIYWCCLHVTELLSLKCKRWILKSIIKNSWQYFLLWICNCLVTFFIDQFLCDARACKTLFFSLLLQFLLPGRSECGQCSES